jgi:hypothetical protein
MGVQWERCAFLPDGRRLVIGGADGTVKQWDANTGTLLISVRVLLARGEHVVLDKTGYTVIEATSGAWRWLRYQLLDEAGHIVDVVPAETFGALPAPKRMVTRG